MILLLVLLLAALLGFTAHSAGICAVKAVSEIITTRRTHMLASFGKTALWILTAMMVVMWLAPNGEMPMLLAPSLASIAGAFLFGIGAALNGGCAISTVTRLGNGEMRMLLTIAGVVLAIAVIDGELLTFPALSPSQTVRPFVIGGWALRLSVAVLLSWAVWETIGLWRKRDPTCGLLEGVLHRRWRLSVAAAVIGLASCYCAGCRALGLYGYPARFCRLANRRPHDAVCAAPRVVRGAHGWRYRLGAAAPKLRVALPAQAGMVAESCRRSADGRWDRDGSRRQ